MKLLDKERNLLLEIREVQDMFYFDDYLCNHLCKKKQKEPQENLISFCEQYLNSLNSCTIQEFILEAQYPQDFILLNGHKEEICSYDNKNGLQLKQPNLF